MSIAYDSARVPGNWPQIPAWHLSAASKAFLFRLEPTDPRAFAAEIVSLFVAALVASPRPARRAASVDPMVALRTE